MSTPTALVIDAAIIRMLLGNQSEANVKPELIDVAAVVGVGQMEAATGKVGWTNFDAYFGDALGIAYKFAQAWAITGNTTEQRSHEYFQQATKSGADLKDKLIQAGLLITNGPIIQVDPYETNPANPDAEETFRVKPFTGRSSSTANLG